MKFFVWNKKQLLLGGVCCVAALSLLFGLIFSTPKIISAMTKKKEIPIYCVDREEKIASLSFDAAWGNEDTQQLIDILGKYQVKATFFIVGEWVDKYPESVKALSDAGHEIMNHSDTHPHMPKLSIEEMRKEIRSCDDKIEKITGKRPFLFRPPYGDYSNELIEALRLENHYCIQWDVDSLDWKDPTPEQMQKTVMKKVKKGSICLFHNAAKNTPAALPGIIEQLQKEGYKLVPISELIYRDNYIIDNAGKQISQKAAGSTSSGTEIQKSSSK